MSTERRTLAALFVPPANLARPAMFLAACIAAVSLGSCGSGDDGGDPGGGTSNSKITEEWQARLSVESIADWVMDSVTDQLAQGSYKNKVVPSSTGSATVTGTALRVNSAT